MDILTLLIIFIIIEFVESYWQRSDSFYGLLKNNYNLYSKSPILYILSQVSFFYTIFLSLYLNNFGFWLSSILIMKFFDIALRLTIMKKIYKDEDISTIVPFDIKMTPLFRYLNVIIYPLSFIFANNIF